uniref:Uncharacterized protein n=1 Tax=Anguilla anguilla TaxID=7936 RepID=A0A0E9PAI1_ANGAN
MKCTMPWSLSTSFVTHLQQACF